ncbi:MAG: hypothetical protein Q9M08_07755 [Mariprofundus sp.]|nr:hypothetical protein [Mariprofundus sp.]
MKTLFTSIAALILMLGAVVALVLIFLFDMPPGEILGTMQTEGKFLLYKYELVEKLTAAEKRKLYQSNCTRQCHSKDLIEKTPRTAAEWDNIVIRMQAPDRADLSDREAAVITRYLKSHFLSNIPTVLPEKTMRFLKRHLWKSDFGAGDLYLDVIYIPRTLVRLLPYLVASNDLPKKQGAYFVVYLNTHQGSIPPWKLDQVATLSQGIGDAQKALGWQILYEGDYGGQLHHIQGVLTFPDFDESQFDSMQIAIDLPGMRERVFQWKLPVPPMAE